MYKSKLQELCHKEKWALPVYTCLKDGEEHCPNFKASVLVGGVTFNSPRICKSSKQAHDEAAAAAFLHFTSVLEMDFKRKLEMYAKKKKLPIPVYYSEKMGVCFRARVCIGEDYSFRSEELTAEKAENAAAQIALLSLSTHAFLQDLATKKKVMSDDDFSSKVQVEAEVSKGAIAKSKDRPAPVDNVGELAPRLGSLLISDKEDKNPISGSPPNLSSSIKNVDCNEDCKASEIESYLVGNRFQIFTNMALPEGTVVLPVDENRWTVMTLEFPAKKPSPCLI